MKIRDVTQLIGMMERGDLAAALNEELREVITGCQDAAGGKGTAKGKLSLVLAVEVKGDTLTLEGEIVSKPPKIKRRSSTYFVGANGEILTEHPQQVDMFPRDARERERDQA